MSLYRKYRPSKFEEIIGQEHLVKALATAAERGELSHAYLFSGSRGTGKTTVARILARAAGATDPDIYEIDAASNRGIDEIRALREAVRVLPLASPRKVYIVDEVHMLTRDAFNALLKTLEEPPAHVIFILATTEAHKLPETIVSRCQNFAFRRPTLAELRQLVEQVARAEGVKVEPAAVELIALLADGSFRDAMVVFQQVLAMGGSTKKITAEAVSAVTGAPPAALARELTEALMAGEAPRALAAVAEATRVQADLKTLLKMTLESLRLVLLLKIDLQLAKSLSAGRSQDELTWLEGLRDSPALKRLPEIIRRLLAAHEELTQAAVPALVLELAVTELSEHKL